MKKENRLTPKQERFCLGILAGKSQADAYRAAFNCAKMKDATIYRNAVALMRDNRIAARIEAMRAPALEAAQLEVSEVVREIRRVAFSDIAGIYHPDGRVKLPNEPDPATRACVKKFKIDECGRIEYEFWDKIVALEKAAKILGLYEKDNAQKGIPAVCEVRLVALRPA